MNLRDEFRATVDITKKNFAQHENHENREKFCFTKLVAKLFLFFAKIRNNFASCLETVKLMKETSLGKHLFTKITKMLTIILLGSRWTVDFLGLLSF